MTKATIETECIDTRITNQDIVAGTTGQLIIARISAERVITVAAIELIIPRHAREPVGTAVAHQRIVVSARLFFGACCKSN